MQSPHEEQFPEAVFFSPRSERRRFFREKTGFHGVGPGAVDAIKLDSVCWKQRDLGIRLTPRTQSYDFDLQRQRCKFLQRRE
jgi:hypothetical protein